MLLDWRWKSKHLTGKYVFPPQKKILQLYLYLLGSRGVGRPIWAPYDGLGLSGGRSDYLE